VIGLVGGAGSRQALDLFFRNLPDESGMAFVIVTRMAARQVNQLPALLQRRTNMPVVVAADGVLLQPDHVYVAPAGICLSLDGEEVRLQPKASQAAETSGLLDTFLQSLATTYQGNAVAVLLSGTGTDGVAGLAMVKQAGGLTMVQDADEAAHGALPRRAIKADLATVVATVGELARQLVQQRGALALCTDDDGRVTAEPPEEIYGKIFAHLLTHTGHDLSHYKASTIQRRIARRMQITGILDVGNYADFLRTNVTEALALFQDSLVSVTSFFRDADAYTMLARDCIPQLFAGKMRHDAVRVWVAGCATGEEAYSVAMQLVEYATNLQEAPRLQVFATDLDDNAIAIARRGIYPLTIAQNMSPDRLERFFIRQEDGYQVRPEIRENLLFAVHDLLKDPPFSRLELICCRNVLIYFNRDAQEKLFTTFHYALNPSGYLFLGTSESADSAAELFAVLNKQCHLYQRRDVLSLPQRPLSASRSAVFGGRAPTRVDAHKQNPSRTLEELYTNWSLRRHTPPRLLVNDAYEITYLFGDVGDYLQEREGAVTQNILQRILPDLRLDLRTALYQAFSKEERTISRMLQIERNGEPQLLQLEVGPIAEPGFPDGYVEVLFVAQKNLDMLEGLAAGEVIETDLVLVKRMEEELMRTRERLQSIIEEYEESSQELKTSNEELQSMNEELKSTTEELETSKEELQSMNEELITVNGELHEKVEELHRANSDLLNFVVATDVGAIFLDMRLRITRFTPRATDLFHLLESDRGRPFSHVTHQIRHAGLAELVDHIRQSTKSIEETVQSEDGRWYILRLFPYRTVNDHFDGVVITFVDISDLKRAESEERQRHQQQILAELSRQALLGRDLDSLFQTVVSQVTTVLDMEFCKVLRLQPDGHSLLLHAGAGWRDGVIGHAILQTDSGSQAGYTLRTQGPTVVRDLLTETRFRSPSLLMEHNVRSGISVTIYGVTGPYGVLGVHSREPRNFATYDVDFLQAVANTLAAAIARYHAANELKEREATLRRYVDMLQASYDAVIVWSPQQGIEFWNRGAEALYGYQTTEAIGQVTHELLKTNHPQQLPKIMAVLAQGGTWEGELIHQTKAGDEIYVSTRHQLILDEHGMTVVLEINRDITERKQAEIALRQSEERYRYLFEKMDEGFCVVEILFDEDNHPKDYRFLEANPAFEEFTGLRQAVGRTAREMVPGLEDHWVEIYGKVALTGEPIRFEQGSEAMGRWFSVYAYRVGEAGNPRVAILFSNITARKTAEEQLRYQAYLLENVQDAIVSTDMDFHIRTWNKGAEQIYGWSAEEVIGRPVRQLLQSRQSSDQKTDTAALARLLLEQGHWQGEVTQQTKAGTAIAISNITKVLYDNEGKAVGTVAVNRDITMQKEAQRALAASEEKFATAFSSSPIILAITSLATGELLEVNDSFLQITGYTREEVLGRTAVDLGLWLDAENRTAGIAQLQRGEAIRNVEALFLVKDGSIRHCILGATVVEIEGEPCVLNALADISDQKQVEQALKASESQLSLITDNVSGLISYVDHTERYRFVNAVYEAWFAKPRQAIIGTAIRDQVDEQAYARLQPHVEKALRGERTSFENTIHYPDGITRTVMSTYVPDIDADEVLGFYALVTDITDRKQAEERLHFLVEASNILASSLEVNVTLENVAHAAVPGIADWCVIDLLREDGTIEGVTIAHVDPNKIQWAQTLREQYPIDPNTAIGAPNVIRTGLSEFYPVITDEMLEAAAKTEEQLQLLQSIGYRSVMIVPLETRGEIMGAITFVLTESERYFVHSDLALAEDLARRAAAAISNARLYHTLHSREQELRVSEERFRSAFEQAAVGMAHLQIDGRYLRVNNRLCDILGYTREELLQKNFAEVTHPDDLGIDLLQAERPLAGEALHQSMEKRYIRKDGSMLWVNITASVVRDDAGKALYGIVVVEDISTRKTAEAALRELNATLEERIAERTAELERSNQDLDQFAYVASHDLRAPLRGIDSLATWISEDAAALLPDSSKDHLVKLRGRVGRMEQLLEDLLTYSRVGRRDGQAELVEIDALLRDLIDLLAAPAGFTVTITTEMPTIQTPRAPLELVFRNLIGNAIKHHHDPANGVIQISAEDQGEYIQFTVADNGPGIDPRHHERIFSMFQTLRPRDEVEGSGMGLAIVQRAIEYRRGQIRIESTLGDGTRFLFTWPKA